jgi:hypothetical protein
VKERPIIMSTDSVRAILAGRKTTTRRVVKPQPYAIIDNWPYIDNPVEVVDEATKSVKTIYSDANMNRLVKPARCPYGQPGDLLYVRETVGIHLTPEEQPPNGYVLYKADFQDGATFEWEGGGSAWRSALFMPRWASRIKLEVTGVKVERVQDITEENAEAEGATAIDPFENTKIVDNRSVFAGIWNQLNAKRGYSWDSNPWVWVIEFKVLPTNKEPIK